MVYVTSPKCLNGCSTAVCPSPEVDVTSGYHFRVLERSNTVAVDKTRTYLRDHLLKIEIFLLATETSVEMQACTPARWDIARRVIHGMEEQAPADLLSARPQGKNGAVAVTFDGTALPEQVLRYEVFDSRRQLYYTAFSRTASAPKSPVADDARHALRGRWPPSLPLLVSLCREFGESGGTPLAKIVSVAFGAVLHSSCDPPLATHIPLAEVKSCTNTLQSQFRGTDVVKYCVSAH